MNDKFFEQRCKDALSSEKNFAKAITSRYKMSNTRNKEFVNIMLISIKDVTQYFNLDILIHEINKLDFFVTPLTESNNTDLLAVIKNGETRTCNKPKIFNTSQYLY